MVIINNNNSNNDNGIAKSHDYDGKLLGARNRDGMTVKTKLKSEIFRHFLHF